MTAAVLGMSHSPLIGRNDPAADVLAKVFEATEELKAFVVDHDPELVILFHPDHYNGFFYKEMPPFCLATAAISVGDFGSTPGPLAVPTHDATLLAQSVMDFGLDLTVSARMHVDHGAVQPLEVLFGGLTNVPVIPVFVNGVATPLVPMERIRSLGRAIGKAVHDLWPDRRVLFLASGGLSHDPPVPVLAGAPERVAEALIEGTPPTPEQRARGEQRVIESGRTYLGNPDRIQLNPEWDNALLDLLAANTLEPVDHWTVEWMNQEGGHSSHEVRTWVAAFSALGATSPDYAVENRFYQAIPEWIAGFAYMAAR